jgi:hypothetical protein
VSRSLWWAHAVHIEAQLARRHSPAHTCLLGFALLRRPRDFSGANDAGNCMLASAFVARHPASMTSPLPPRVAFENPAAFSIGQDCGIFDVAPRVVELVPGFRIECRDMRRARCRVDGGSTARLCFTIWIS